MKHLKCKLDVKPMGINHYRIIMELNFSTLNRKWKNFTTLWSFIGCLILFLISNYLITTKQSSISALFGAFHHNTTLGANPHVITNNNVTQKPRTKTTMIKMKKCNLFEGRWVYDPKKIPNYDATRCPFFDQKLSCRKNGRPDSDYLKWKWEATDCDIPLFNGLDMLERLRNKRVVIVGDSINRNQWVSLACLLYSSISDPSRAEVDVRGSHKFFKAKDYNFTAEFFMHPFLVELTLGHESGRRVLALDKIARSSKKWRGANIMVFNSWHWWTHPKKIIAWNVFEYKGQLIEEMPIELAFERAMKTWARWIENKVDPKKTTVLFRGDSAVHFGKHWCYNSTQLIMDIQSFESRLNPLVEVFDSVIKGMSNLQVKYLNITKLTQYRSDAHPSMYTNLIWKDAGKKPKIDCSHWCLPGLPDTWNRLLYVYLFFDT